MRESSLFKLDGYENPKMLVHNFRGIVLSEGANAVLSQERFKLDRQKWIAGMACIGMTKLTGKSWFVKSANPKEETPDFRATAFNTVEDGKYLIWREVECEIVQCPKGLLPPNCDDPEQTFFEHIKKTKFCKAYPSNFVLLIYSQFACENFNLEKLSQLFVSFRPNLSEIWDLMSISPNQDRHLLSKLYPNRQDSEINNFDHYCPVIS